MTRPSLTPFAWLSIAAAIVTIALKAGAYAITGSVGLLSDALESIVNLVAAIVALVALNIAQAPADDDHAFGHEKAEYFSSGTEGLMILIAAIAILFAAVRRLIWPQPLEHVSLGLLISGVAALVNLAVALVLLRNGKRHHSITLEADAHHLLTDVITSIGVIAGVALVGFTGFIRLDPILAIVVGLWIVKTGVSLLRRSAMGLLDTAIPKYEREKLEEILRRYEERGARWHALRTREAGPRIFVTLHLLVPGEWSVQRGHDLSEEIEAEIRRALGRAHVVTHLEPIEDEVSYRDTGLDRTTQ